MAESPTPGQRRTEAARQALAATFESPEAKSAYYRDLGRRGNDGRLLLTGEEANALSEAYRLLARIAARHPKIADPRAGNGATDDPEEVR